MNSLEVRAWHRKGSPPQLALNVNCETEVDLTPEQADKLADQLKWFAQFVRHHIKRQRGGGEPLQHLRHSNEPCPFFLAGDVTWIVGKTYTDGERGENFAKCLHCFGSTPPGHGS